MIKNHCDALASPSYTNFTISIIILLGILVSYLPQHHRIISRRSSEGLSPYFILLGTTSGTSAFANILVLPASRADLACCREITGFECFAGLLGIAQVGIQWTCFAIILLLFLLFFPRATAFTPPKPASSNPSYRTALLVTCLCIIHALIVVVLSLVFVYTLPNHLQTWANALGILAAVLASIQYLPQLYTTWRLQDVASLSIPMMCIQTPGSFIWAGSLASRLGVEGWSAWGLYLVTGCLQGGLLSMGIYFEVRKRREKRSTRPNGTSNGHVVSEEEGAADGASERTSLLGNER